MTNNDVLVVDDDDDMTEVMLLILSQAGYAPRRAANGQEALEAVEKHVPALILLDMLMPVMNGWQCAKQLREKYGRSVPIITVTAAEHGRSRADEVDADDVLPKPFQVSELLRMVRRYAPAHVL